MKPYFINKMQRGLAGGMAQGVECFYAMCEYMRPWVQSPVPQKFLIYFFVTLHLGHLPALFL
jgi:hypothetical protein